MSHLCAFKHGANERLTAAAGLLIPPVVCEARTLDCMSNGGFLFFRL